ncbi:hypothetical protein FACS18942_00700 [Planctomycetales bacterium]|nr:hypothetical protein FACS18942_00700 [Planctomycetales bacterium]GHT34609.1 hypothetical protein FACS189427_02210 [Planctomycetales bacterium]
MNDNFKIDETVEYHLCSPLDYIRGEDPFVTGDYYDAVRSFENGDFVAEHRFCKQSSEWMKVEQHTVYEWHQ